MSILQLKFDTSKLPNGYVYQERSDFPKWANPDNGGIWGSSVSGNVKNWYSSGNIDVFMYKNANNSYVQYGQNIASYATAKLFRFQYTVLNETINSDMSIDADVEVWIDDFYSSKTQFAQNGLQIKNNVKIGSQQISNYTGTSADAYSLQPNPRKITTHIHVPPMSYSSSTSASFNTSYPNHEHPDLSFVIGANLYNPLSGLYTPMKLKVNGQWVTLNNTAKKNKRKKNGDWVDIAQENLSSQNAVNTGHNRRKKGGQYQQMPLPK